MSEPTMTHFRKSYATHASKPRSSAGESNQSSLLSRFFPPSTEAATEKKENAPEVDLEAESEEADAKAKEEIETTASQLPSVPTTDPADPDHAQKKQKQDNES